MFRLLVKPLAERDAAEPQNGTIASAKGWAMSFY